MISRTCQRRANADDNLRLEDRRHDVAAILRSQWPRPGRRGQKGTEMMPTASRQNVPYRDLDIAPSIKGERIVPNIASWLVFLVQVRGRRQTSAL